MATAFPYLLPTLLDTVVRRVRLERLLHHEIRTSGASRKSMPSNVRACRSCIQALTARVIARAAPGWYPSFSQMGAVPEFLEFSDALVKVPHGLHGLISEISFTSTGSERWFLNRWTICCFALMANWVAVEIPSSRLMRAPGQDLCTWGGWAELKSSGIPKEVFFHVGAV